MKEYHPLVHLLFFGNVIAFSMFLMHPICILLSMLGALIALRRSEEGIGKWMIGFAVLFLMTAIVNPLFSHRGVTVLWEFPWGNPLTLESLLFGMAAGGMLVCVMAWFAVLHSRSSTERILFLFGRILPVVSLLLSMIFRFVPMFVRKWHETSLAREGIGKKNSASETAVRISALLGQIMEHGIALSDAMSAKGFGSGKRSFYSDFRLSARDVAAMLWVLLLSAVVWSTVIGGGLGFAYYPQIGQIGGDPIAKAAYCLLCMTPCLIEGWEVIRWNTRVLKK